MAFMREIKFVMGNAYTWLKTKRVLQQPETVDAEMQPTAFLSDNLKILLCTQVKSIVFESGPCRSLN